MGLMLSILVVCVGVIEALSCFEHFQYGVIHCATNVYESARRRSSVFLKYTSRRLKLLSENSISEYEEQPEIDVFEPIKFDYDERQTQLLEEEFPSIRKPKAIRISPKPSKKLEKEDKIQIVKALLERPRRPKAVRSISMPCTLEHTEEDIELSKIINDLAIEPIEEVNIEIEDGNFEVLSRKFDELFNEEENPQDCGFKGSPLDDVPEGIEDDLEETKFAELEVVCHFDDKSIFEEMERSPEFDDLSLKEEGDEQQKFDDMPYKEKDEVQQKSDDVSIREEETDSLKLITEKEKPVTGVIKTNISQRVSEKGADYFRETLSKRGSRFDRSVSVDFSKVRSMRINKPLAMDVFSEMSNDSSKLISEESIPNNKLDDIILETDTPPEEIIDKTFEEIYENICDESLDVANTFEEIEKNILEDAVSVEGQDLNNQGSYVSDDRFNLLDDTSKEGETALSSGKTVPIAVFLKAVEQLAELLVRDSLNLHQMKNLISENLSNLNYEEKFNSSDKLGTHLQRQPENKTKSLHVSESKVPKENVCSVQEVPEVETLIKREEKGVSNDDRLRESETKAVLTKKDDFRLPVEEEFDKISCSVMGSGISNLTGSDNKRDVEPVKRGLEKETIHSAEFPAGVDASTEMGQNVLREIPPGFPDSGGAITGVKNRTELPRQGENYQNGRTQERVEIVDRSDKGVDHIKAEVEDKTTGFISNKEETVDFRKLQGEKSQPVEIEDNEILKCLDIPETEIPADFPQIEESKTGLDSRFEACKDNQNIMQEIDKQTKKPVDVITAETKVLHDKTGFPQNAEVTVDVLEKLPEELEIPKENIQTEVAVQLDTIPCRDSTIKDENIQIAESKQEHLLALVHKTPDENKKETETTAQNDKNKKMEEMMPQVTLAGDEENSSVPKYQGFVEKLRQDEQFPVETEMPKRDMKTEATRPPDTSHGDSDAVDEKIQNVLIYEPSLALEYKNKEGTVDSAEKIPVTLEKLKENVKTEVVIEPKKMPQGDSDIISENIQIIESKNEPFLTLEYKNKEGTVNSAEEIPMEREKPKESVKTESENQPSLALEKKNSCLKKEGETIIEQVEVKMVKDIDKPQKTIESVLKPHDRVGESQLNVKLQQIDVTKEKNAEKLQPGTINKSESTKTDVEGKTEFPAQDNQNERTLKGTEVKGQTYKAVDIVNTETEVGDKNGTILNKEMIDFVEKVKGEKPLLLGDENPKENVKMEVAIQQDTTCYGDSNIAGGTRKGPLEENKMESTKESLVDKEGIITAEVKKESDTLSGDSGVKSETKEDILEKDKKETECTMEPLVERKEGIITTEIKKETETRREENNKVHGPGDILKLGEPKLKFHDKPGDTEDKVEFEQVGVVEGNDVDKLQIDSKNEAANAEPAGLGSAVEKKDEHSSDSKNSTAHETSGATSSAPEAFWLIFSGEYTKAMSKDWHSGHFSCWQCDEALTGQRYVLRDDHPYCIKCYESVFANVCEECNKIIGIDSKDLSYKDKHWHEACFLCNKCRVSLVDKQFGSKADKIYCGNCYDAQFASRCDGCGEIFRAGTKKMEYKTRQWHEKCFCCCVCKTPIGTKSFIPREQEIYCATCYEEKFATRCVKCNKIITSGGVTYKNEPWHRECFTCTNCNTSLAGQRFTSRDEKPYCADCFGELFAKRCTACSRPITGIGGTRFISFEDRHWHNDCFICASCKTSLVGRGFITDGDDIICPECAKQKLM